MRSFLASVLDKFGPHLALLVAILLTTLAITCGADEVNATSAPPKTLPMAAAILVAKADQEIVKVRTALVESLKKAQADATKKGDLDGALSIKAKIEEVSKDLPAKAAAPAAPPTLQGVYAFDFHTGHRGKLEVRKHEAWENTSHGDVMLTSTGWTITWANGSHWDIGVEDGALVATASDGHTALAPATP